MKTKTIFSIFAAAVCVMTALAPVCHAKNEAKLIVFVSPESPAALSAGEALFDERLIPAENQLAKALKEQGVRVMTAGDLVPGGKLSASQIAEAGRGSFKQVHQAAVVNSAHYILNGFLGAEVTEEEAVGVKLKKVVSTISYKLYETASAEVLHVDTATFTDVGKSPKKLFAGTLNQMAAGISREIGEILPRTVTKEQSAQLAALQRQAGAQETPAYDSGQEKSGTPQIVIINPPLGRGFTIEQKERAVDMEGMVIDHTGSGIKYFKVNREPVRLNDSGEFTYGIMLDPGDNQFELAAMSNSGKMVEKQVTLTLPDDKTPPNIVITEPLITRGFTTIVKDPVSRLAVKGRVRDDSEVQYVHVNGEPVEIDEQGGFAADVGLGGGQTRVAVVSADIFGNTTKKEFQVEKGRRGAISASGSASGAPGESRESARNPVLWGLGIGVSQYSSSIMDLKYAVEDVKSMARFFESQAGRLFSEVHFKVLADADVTRDAIIENMAAHLGQAGPDDVVFLFIAGHGIKHRQTGSYYFVPADADNKNIVSRGLRMSDFEEAVSILSKNVNKVIIAMDTCHAGAMQVGMRSGVSSENLAETLREASGLYILSASKGGETSMEGEEFQIDGKGPGHGAFTYALITGMQGEANYDGDSIVSLNELFQYVSRTVPRLTKGRQHPYLRVSGTDMPLVMIDN